MSDITYPNRYTISYLKTKCIPWNDCWLWEGKLCNGYATVRYKQKDKFVYKRVHRMTYEMIKGLIPKGLVLDHLCDNKECINPNHLNPTTISKNADRGGSQSGINRNKTHCKRGHPFNKENTYINPNNNTRHCKQCKNELYA